MKTIIAGSRTITSYQEVQLAIEASHFKITEVVSGCAQGPDTIGQMWASNAGIPIKKFPADWDKFGNAAGIIRNTEMAKYAGPDGALIAIWDGQSSGTRSMIALARKYGLKVFVHPVGL